MKALNPMRADERGVSSGSSSLSGSPLTRESDGRMLDGRQSTPRSNPPPVAAPWRGSSTSLALTRPAGHFATAPSAGSDEPGFPETCGKPDARPPASPTATPGTSARRSLCRATSRGAIKLRLRSLRQRRRIPLKFRLGLIEQRGQAGPGSPVANHPLPRGIAIQFGQERGQIRDEFFALGSREALNGGFDFLHRAHGGKLRLRRCGGKLPARRPPGHRSTTPIPQLCA